jgi:hypothetical protein
MRWTMANVSYWSGGWAGLDFKPGDEHPWALSPINSDEVIAVTAHATHAGQLPLERELRVEDVRAEADTTGGRRLFFKVRNTGPNIIIAYQMNFSFVTP